MGVDVDQRVTGIAQRQFREEAGGRRGVPDRLGGEGELVGGGSNVVLPEADDPHPALFETRVDRADRGEDRDPVAALAQAHRRIEGDLGLAAVDVGVVENEDDVHGGSRFFPADRRASRLPARATIRKQSAHVYRPAVDRP